jgi:hypothetical protein
VNSEEGLSLLYRGRRRGGRGLEGENKKVSKGGKEKCYEGGGNK